MEPEIEVGMLVKIEPDTAYEVVRKIAWNRVIINYGGAFAFADKRPDDGTWELSGKPAITEDEQKALRELIAPTLDVTDVTVTKDGG